MRLSLPRSLPDNPLKRLEPSWRDALRSPLVIALIALLLIQLVIALVASSDRGLVPASDSLPLLDLEVDPITEIAIAGDEVHLLEERAARLGTVTLQRELEDLLEALDRPLELRPNHERLEGRDLLVDLVLDLAALVGLVDRQLLGVHVPDQVAEALRVRSEYRRHVYLLQK